MRTANRKAGNAGSGRIYQAVSRALDISVGGLALVLLSPILAGLMVCSRMSTGASAIFSQRRVGYRGETFLVYKIRTLRAEAPCDVHRRQSEHLAPAPCRVMRRLKLDELPQLWNVLRGEMALVGPRPIIPEEYREKSLLQRLTVKPGLTGMWQVGPGRDDPFHEAPEYDLFYVANQSMRLDLWLLWRTGVMILFGRDTSLDTAIVRRGGQPIPEVEPAGVFTLHMTKLEHAPETLELAPQHSSWAKGSDPGLLHLLLDPPVRLAGPIPQRPLRLPPQRLDAGMAEVARLHVHRTGHELGR